MTRRFLLAVLLAFGVHALLAVALGLLLTHTPPEVVSAELDLSSVALSFSEQEQEAPPVAQAPSMASPPPAAEPTPERTPAPAEAASPPDFLAAPPEAASIVLPEPRTEEKPVFESVEVVREEPPPKAEKTEKPEETEPPKEKAREDPPEKASETPASAASAPATPAPQQARVEAPPKPRRTIRPKYPEASRQRGEEGDVQVELDVTAQGTVSAVRVTRSSGYPELDAAAQKAARAARFTPARAGGRPVATTARLTLSFRLKGR